MSGLMINGINLGTLGLMDGKMILGIGLRVRATLVDYGHGRNLSNLLQVLRVKLLHLF